MTQVKSSSDNNFMLGLFVCIGLIVMGYLIAGGIVEFKQMDRSVLVKGLAEREVPADIAIWPIQFIEVSNDLPTLYATIPQKTKIIVDFLKENGFTEDEISTSTPTIEDRQAQGYYDAEKVKYRFANSTTVTVYTHKIDKVLESMNHIIELGKRGITLSGNNYNTRTQFIFSNLNDIKPAMIEEATKNAREVAVKFANDSQSKLGKIKSANQGQFSISDRDSNTPHIKTVRVVTTLEYYLSD